MDQLRSAQQHHRLLANVSPFVGTNAGAYADTHAGARTSTDASTDASTAAIVPPLSTPSAVRRRMRQHSENRG